MANLELISQAIDFNKKGYLEKEDLHKLVKDMDLSEEDFSIIFDELDENKDGKITPSTLTSSAQKLRLAGGYLSQSTKSLFNSTDELIYQDNDVTDDQSNNKFIEELEVGYQYLSENNQDHICKLHQCLNFNDMADIDTVELFEKIILGVVEDIRQNQLEKDRLHQLYKREKEEHYRHLQQLEEDLEIQIRKVETMIRKEEQEKAAKERKEMKSQFENEMKGLQNTLAQLQKLDRQNSKEKEEDTKKLSSIYLMEENRQLRTLLSEVETNLAVSKSEFAVVNAERKVSLPQLTTETSPMLEVVHEPYHLTRQINSLQNANKKLQDINDDLRAALEGQDILPNKTFKSLNSKRHSYHEVNTGIEADSMLAHKSIGENLSDSVKSSLKSLTQMQARFSTSNLSSSKSKSTSNLSSIKSKVSIDPQKGSAIYKPEIKYKVILAGDAAVGKSSFILRLCKNTFMTNLSTTLGVDFYTKEIEVDERTVSLQLWDTAGQERYRSIAKSYFRRADVVLLLYDCTHEKSFLNVRDWMSIIENGSDSKIPVMIIANKTDLRDEIIKNNRQSVINIITYEDGKKLADQYGAMFIESSAKNGIHINEACVEITRELLTYTDMKANASGMKLQEINNSQNKKCVFC